ncbi:YcjF family protein, partial [Enterococcus faecalis]
SNSQTQLDKVFVEFLADVSPDVKKKSHQTIHFAALSAAIIGFSPIPFSDAFLLVPVQLTMMSRLHKNFVHSWSGSLGESLNKE